MSACKSRFWRRSWDVTGNDVWSTRIGAEKTHLKAKYLWRTLKWFIFCFGYPSMIHVTITLQYLEMLWSFELLLNGKGLATLHAPGYASPDGTVTFVVKLAPAKEIQTRHGQDFQSTRKWTTLVFDQFSFRVILYKMSFAAVTIFIFPVRNVWVCAVSKKVMNSVWSKIH